MTTITMTTIREIKPRESDAKAVLLDCASKADDVTAVIVIELRRDGTRHLVTNTASFEEKCLLKCFLDSWVYRWFQGDYEEPVST